MTFTYKENLPDDLAKVRFHIGDTSNEGHYLVDETINALIVSEGSVGATVVACLKYIITQLSSPDFKLDWMSVSNEKARAGFENLLIIKAQEFGVSLSGLTTKAVIGLPRRADSLQTDNDYDGTSA